MTKQRLLETLGRSARLKVVNELKRAANGLAVRELCDRLGMSYMGIKDLCVDLQKRGLLVTWRQPQKLGRPTMLYRLTEKAHELFPSVSNALTLELLEITRKIYGATAPEKLLLHIFQDRAEQHRTSLPEGAVEERAEALARRRDAEGYMSALERSEGGGLCIVEHHSPLLDVLEAYPGVAKMEAEMFQRILGVPVLRSEQRVAGGFCATFQLGALEHAGG